MFVLQSFLPIISLYARQKDFFMSTIKESLDLFLNSNYKNKLTKSTAKTAFKRIEHFEEIDIVKINELYE